MTEPGTVAWIRSEVEHSMAEARACLTRFQSSGARPADIRSGMAHLHQVTGALQIVGSDGAARFCEEIEALLRGFGHHRPPASEAAVRLARRSMDALIQFVNGCASGRELSPLLLDPLLQEMQRARGVTVPGPAELFYPDLGLEPPPHEHPRTVAAGALPVLVAAERARFERGLLAWMRGDDTGLAVMRDALASIDSAGLAPRDRVLWWAATAMLEGVLAGALAAGPEVKKLCARIDQQMKHFAGGRTLVAEGLQRDVLYQIACADPIHPMVARVQTHYRLDRLMSRDDSGTFGLLEPEERTRLGQRARESLQRAKIAWLSYTTGVSAALDAFTGHVSDLRTAAGTLLNLPLMRLGDAIAESARALRAGDDERPEELVAEMASALLVAESALEFAEQPDVDLEAQVELISQRMLHAASGRSGTQDLPPVSILDQRDPRSGRRAPLGDVAREIHSNLMVIEQVLDGFFRDARRRPGLAELGPPLEQVRGALQLLDLDEASNLMRRCERLINKLASEERSPSEGDVELVANGLSSLDLFVQDLEHRSPDRDRLIHDALSRFSPRTPSLRTREDGEGPPARSLENEVRLALGRIGRLGKAWERRREDHALERQLASELESLERDAEVVGDSALATAAGRALESMRRGSAPDAGRALRALGDGELSPAAPRPSPEAARLVNAGQDVVERELYRVYLGEAREVVEAIARGIEACRREDQPHEALLTLRRNFHTLKGSGRMVGLEDLAKAALQVELVLNHWLQEELAVTPELVDFLGEARRAFADWIARLESGEALSVNGDTLAARGAALLDAATTAGDRAAPPTPPAAPALAQGDVVPPPGGRLPEELFRIFIAESGDLLAVLGHALDGDPGPEALRAAHTLAGITRTAGFPDIAAAASALERWLMAAAAQPSGSQPPARAAGATLAALVEAFERLREGQPAGSRAGETVASLDAATRALQLAPRPRLPAGVGDELRDDLDQTLLPLFLEEAEDLMAVIGEELRQSHRAPDDEHIPQALRRTLHTLKGSARLVGAMRFGDLVHRMEARVAEAIGRREFPGDLVDELEEQLDEMGRQLRHISEPAGDAAGAGETLPSALRAGGLVPAMRVSAHILDAMVSRAGEVSIARTHVESGVQAVRQHLVELGDTVARLRGQLREMELQSEIAMPAQLASVTASENGFDPLEFDRYTRLQELVRLMAESTADVVTVQSGLRRALDEATTALRTQARSGRELQDSLMSVRTVAFSTLVDRLYRVLRQGCRELGKQARLEVDGQQVEVDRGVLEKLLPVLEHLLRNAVVHGIEPVAVRRERGKDETGQVRIELRQEASEIVLDVIDDGGGIDYAAVGRRAVASGLARPEQIEDRALLRRLIFGAGFTTVEEVTELAGRGIGLDAVRSEVQGLGGWVELDSSPGEGSRFRAHLPLTLVVVQALLVRGGGRGYALPTHLVEHVQRMDAATVAAAQREGHLTWEGHRHPFHFLGQLLAEPGDAPVEARNPVILMRAGEERLALQVESVVRNHEAVLRNLGPQIASIPGLIGATVLPDGEIAPILNPFFLAQYHSSARPPVPAPAPPPAEVDTRPLVMVVDDSLTVRRLLEGLLARAGYRVITARDGVEAEHLLGEFRPEVMLVDIEMPRMDGFELTRLVRGNRATAHIPIIIITSRSAEKHREYAMKLGADLFVGKPFVEEEILHHVAGLTSNRATASGRIPA